MALRSDCLVNSSTHPLPLLCLIPQSTSTNCDCTLEHSATSPRPTQRKSNIARGLSTCTHVFVRHDAVRKPLQPPYDGPFPVLKRTLKHFTLYINGRRDTVSIDRLKPAHLDIATDHLSPTNNLNNPTTGTTTDQPQAVTTPTTTPTRTRSGRRVHFPNYLSRNVS